MSKEHEYSKPINIEDLKQLEIDERIKHLSLEQINDLIKRYYLGETLKSLNSEFNLKLSNYNVGTILPQIVTNINCKYCDVPLQKGRVSRTKSSFYFEHIKSFCPKCGHSTSEYCSCNECQHLREQDSRIRLQQKKEIIETVYGDSFHKVEEDSLTLKDRLYLATLLRAGIDEQMNSIKPLLGKETLISPTEDFTRDIIRSLFKGKIIKPHSQTSVDAFKDDETFPYSYNPFMIEFVINIIPNDNNYNNMLHRLLYPNPEIFQIDKVFCLEMWKKIGLEECIQYLYFSLEKVGYEFNVGEKTCTVFNELLEHFSVSQIYGIIFKAIANVTKYQREIGINNKHAANLVITNCERYGERAIAEDWKLTHFNRNNKLPETVIHQVFFYRIIQISSLGFTEKPTDKF